MPRNNSRLEAAKRVLVYRLGSLGDTVVALPCLHLIARTFPRAERTLLTNFPVNAKAPASASVLGASGLIHGYMRYTVGTRNPFELSRLWWRISHYRPDVLVYLMPIRGAATVRRDRLFFKLTGVKNIVGLPSDRESIHTFDESSGLFESEASRLARSLSEFGNADLDNSESWNLRLTEQEYSNAAASLNGLEGRRFLVCGPGSKMQSKDWGTENWSALLGKMTQLFPTHGLVLVGAKDDSQICQSLGQSWRRPWLNLSGQPPRETAAVIERADLFVGTDSGPGHMAEAVGTPCVLAFSARVKPGVWYPHGAMHRVIYHKVDCWGCNLETCIAQRKKCIMSISIDEMLEAAVSACRRTGIVSAPLTTLTVH